MGCGDGAYRIQWRHFRVVQWSLRWYVPDGFILLSENCFVSTRFYERLAEHVGLDALLALGVEGCRSSIYLFDNDTPLTI